MCFDRNINGNRDVNFLIGIIGHCTDQRKLLYYFYFFAAPPRIVLDPPYQIVRQGDSARIICTATGDQPIQIQWAKQGQPYLPRSVTARGGQLAFQRISLDDQGKLQSCACILVRH